MAVLYAHVRHAMPCVSPRHTVHHVLSFHARPVIHSFFHSLIHPIFPLRCTITENVLHVIYETILPPSSPCYRHHCRTAELRSVPGRQLPGGGMGVFPTAPMHAQFYDKEAAIHTISYHTTFVTISYHIISYHVVYI